MQKVLVLGAGGMLGHKLLITLEDNFDVYGTMRGIQFPFIEEKCRKKIYFSIDAQNIESISNIIEDIRPHFVLNCIGLIKQREESFRPVTSIYINSILPHLVFEICQEYNAKMIQISTDCVFSGKKGNYLEKDFADANDLYGRTKYLGELNNINSLTIRTSIIGRELYTSYGLIDWFLSQQGKSIKGYNNAIFSGLTTLKLSEVIAEIMQYHSELNGLYHISSSAISKYDLLKKINDMLNLDVDIIPDYKYKIDRSLNSDIFFKTTKILKPSWENMLIDFINDFKNYNGRRLDV